MNPMHDAIKKKRMGSEDQSRGLMHDAEMAESSPAPEKGMDLQALVESLNDEQKAELMGLLDSSNGDTSAVMQGAPSQAERGKIAQRSVEEDSGGVGEEESDEIAMSMLDSRDKRGTASEKPSGLGARMRQGLAQKLKGKGKL